MLDVEFAQLSDRGRVREHNEDYVGHVVPAEPGDVRTHGWLFALADGVGGQEKGEVASCTAVESVLADFRAYRAAQLQVEAVYRDPEDWTRKSILNVAHMGRFSSDATIRGYARDIWRVAVRGG